MIQTFANRIAQLIIERAAGRRFKTVSALRQWIRFEFGLGARFVDLGASETGWLERIRRSDGSRIVVNTRLGLNRQMRVLIHELAEWVALDLGERLVDSADCPAAIDCPDPALSRHQIALAVEAQVTRRWGIDNPPSSFSVYDRLRIGSPYGKCGARYTFDGGGYPDTQPADPLEDACL